MKRPTSSTLSPRKEPRQRRARQTRDDILQGAARVFKREGWRATTNRIAAATGVSVGSLYEYFPNKQALLLALAERHVALAERTVGEAIAAASGTTALVEALQAAIVESQRYPSHAVSLIDDVPRVGPALRARVERLRDDVIAALTASARDAALDHPERVARAAFGVIGELSAKAAYEDALDLLPHYRAMARSLLRRRSVLRRGAPSGRR